jgi:hypothetical protein
LAFLVGAHLGNFKMTHFGEGGGPLRLADGLFRLWLVCSVAWISFVGVMTWSTFPASDALERIPFTLQHSLHD